MTAPQARARNRLVLVCGGRDYTNRLMVSGALDALLPEPTAIIESGDTGAAALAVDWATAMHIRVITIRANPAHGRAAGRIKIAKMLSLSPGLVLAFDGGPSTALLTRLAEEAGLRVWRA